MTKERPSLLAVRRCSGLFWGKNQCGLRWALTALSAMGGGVFFVACTAVPVAPPGVGPCWSFAVGVLGGGPCGTAGSRGCISVLGGAASLTGYRPRKEQATCQSWEYCAGKVCVSRDVEATKTEISGNLSWFLPLRSDFHFFY